MPSATTRRAVISVMTALGALPLSVGKGLAQAEFPDRLIKIIVPFAAGSANDAVARIVADKMAARLGKPVVVENRPGATGNIGAEVVARAKPDGYTLLIAPPPPFVINRHLFSSLPFDPAALVPVTVIAAVPNVLVAKPALPVRNVHELIALARSQPGKLTYGSTGRGSTPHLAAELLNTLAGTDIVHVSYKGAPLVLNDVVGGSVDLAFVNLIDAWPLIGTGKLKALAVCTAERIADLSDVPALTETLPGFVSTAWYALAAPPMTPEPIVNKLSATVVEAMREPDALAKLKNLRAEPILNSPSQAVAFFADEEARWRRVIVAAAIKPE